MLPAAATNSSWSSVAFVVEVTSVKSAMYCFTCTQGCTGLTLRFHTPLLHRHATPTGSLREAAQVPAIEQTCMYVASNRRQSCMCQTSATGMQAQSSARMLLMSSSDKHSRGNVLATSVCLGWHPGVCCRCLCHPWRGNAAQQHMSRSCASGQTRTRPQAACDSRKQHKQVSLPQPSAYSCSK